MTANIELGKYTQQSYNGRKIKLFYETSKSREFREILGHSKETFKGKLDLVYFLDSNSEISIYLTAGDESFIFEDVNGGFLVGLESFYGFQSRIRGSKGQKVDAFLKQKSNIHNAAFTIEEKNNFIVQHGTEENITKIVRNLPPEKQTTLLQSLQNEFGKGGSFDLKSDAEGVFLQIGDIENREIVIEQLKKLAQNNFANIENALSISKIEQVLDIWEANKSNSHEVAFWQDFLKTNSWILSQVFPAPYAIFENEFYVGGHYSGSLSGSKNTDFGYKNLYSGNTAIIEIKTPTTPLVSKKLYGTRKGIYPMSEDLTGAISQVLNQKDLLQKDFLQNNAKKDFKVWNPKVILIIGSEEYEKMNEDQRACFELFKNSNKDIEIITFDELFEKIKGLKQLYE